MIAKIVKIGNSRGIRIPKPLIEQIGTPDQVELILKDNELIIRSVDNPRKGWDRAFQRAQENQNASHKDEGIDIVENDWDNEEWTW